MVKSKIGLEVDEIFRKNDNRDDLEERLKLRGWELYLYPKYKTRSRWNDDLEFYYYKDYLLIIDFINCNYELYKIEEKGDL